MMIKPTRAIALALIDITSWLTPAQVKLYPNILLASDPPRPPVTDGPTTRKPAGTRSSCTALSKLSNNVPFTPLLPGTASNFSGKTVAERPSFWFYIPYQSNDVASGEFSLEDLTNKKTIYQTSFKLPQIPGFVSIIIPAENAPLNINTQYRWTVTIYCNSQTQQSSDDNFVHHEGLVQRVTLSSDLETQLKTATLSQQIAIYIDNGIWYDATTNLAEIRRRPNDWVKLLRAMGLEELEREQIAGSVLPP
ncbi:MAG TPA: hypothetical protein DDW76_09645 [Cyanobacteria bacterium UBA11369]|nr:hypothetical protein [Cyanobacteria bacterium UBA11371]HBE34982.1 hypothetical protein [Cyanobacteria bacterium UBA11368]HBE49038.1 hypothetical protein [Cyanobacteria bacterium UBA11369]